MVGTLRFAHPTKKDVDARHEAGHDDVG